MDRFGILKTLKALEVVVLAGNPFVEAFLTQVQILTESTAKSNPQDRAGFACFALMPRMGYVLPRLVCKCVEILHIFLLHTQAAEVIILYDVRLESLFPQIYLSLAKVAGNKALFKPLRTLA